MPGEKQLNDRYTLVEQIGSGQLGAVYQARDELLHRDVAIKTITRIEDPKTLAFFYRQWAIQAAISHDHIVEILDLGDFVHEGRKQPFLVMPLLAGKSLSTMVADSDDRLNPALIGELMRQACLGIQRGHDRGLVHGNIKLENLFVLDTGELKVLDFGPLAGVDPKHQAEARQGDAAALVLLLQQTLTSMPTPEGLDDLEALRRILEELQKLHPPDGVTTPRVLADALESALQGPDSSSLTNANQISALLDSARDHTIREDYSKAIDRIDRALSVKPDSREALELKREVQHRAPANAPAASSSSRTASAVVETPRTAVEPFAAPQPRVHPATDEPLTALNHLDGMIALEDRKSTGGGSPVEAAPQAVTAVTEVLIAAASEPDLERRADILEQAVAQSPREESLRRALEQTREKRKVTASIIAASGKLEEAGRWREAHDQWRLLARIHPQAKNLQAQLERLRIQAETQPSTPSATPAQGRQQPEILSEEKPISKQWDLDSAISNGIFRDLVESASDDTIRAADSQVINDARVDEPPSSIDKAPGRRVADPSTETREIDLETEGVPPSALDEADIPRAPHSSTPDPIEATGLESRPEPDSEYEYDDEFEDDEPLQEEEPVQGEALSLADDDPTEQPALEAKPGLLDQIASRWDTLRTALERRVPARSDGSTPSMWWLYGAGATVIALLLLTAIVLLSGGPVAAPSLQKVSLRAYPAAALILIDGEPCGSGECLSELEPGAHRVSASLAGYQMAFEVFEIEQAKPGEVTAYSPPRRMELYLTAMFPSLTIEADLASARVFLDGEQIGELEDGEFSLPQLADGEHALRIAGSGVESKFTIDVEAGKAPAVMSIESREVKSHLIAGLGAQATLYVQPEGGETTLDAEPVGTAGPAGLGLNDLEIGAHELIVGEGSSATSLSFEADNEPRLLAVLRTDRNVGSLRIITAEDGATVFLNDKPYRRKTGRGRLLLFLYPGTYRIRVEKAGFESSLEQVAEVRKGVQVRLEIPISPKPMQARMEVLNGVPGTEVYLDDRRVGAVGSEGIFVLPAVEPGSHSVELRRPGYHTKSMKWDFVSGRTVEVEGKLEKASGTLLVELSPNLPAARVTLRRDGESQDRTLDKRRISLPEGSYTIRAEAAGYEPSSAQVRLTAGETSTAIVTLEPRARKAPPKPRDLLTTLAADSAWQKRDGLLVRRGGGVILLPALDAAGEYRFRASLQKGRRLQWVANYRDQSNYAWFQLGRDNFIRTVVAGGERSKPVTVPHGLEDYREVEIRSAVAGNQIVHQILRQGEWVVLDRWKMTSAGFDQGRFGFRLPGKDSLGLGSLRFTPSAGAE